MHGAPRSWTNAENENETAIGPGISTGKPYPPCIRELEIFGPADAMDMVCSLKRSKIKTKTRDKKIEICIKNNKKDIKNNISMLYELPLTLHL
jgi:hypothetical protein